MRTRAVLVSIQALSAELLASAVCCSSLAKREFGSATGRPVTPALRAKTLGTKANASRAVASPAINRHFNLALRGGFKTETASLYRPMAATRKSKLFIVPIRFCYCCAEFELRMCGRLRQTSGDEDHPDDGECRRCEPWHLLQTQVNSGWSGSSRRAV